MKFRPASNHEMAKFLFEDENLTTLERFWLMKDFQEACTVQEWNDYKIEAGEILGLLLD